MSTPSLYAHLLGPDWERLPERVRRLHTEGLARGRFTLRRGAGPLATLVGWLCRLPPAGEDVPTRLAIRRDGAGLRWERAFGAHALATHQHGVAGPRLVEWHGPIGCVFHVRAEGLGLRYEQVGTWVRLGPWRLGVPRALAPRIEALVTDTPHGMHVHVRIGAALVGPLLSYEGHVLPEETSP
jgi:hypothetical protein